MAGGACERAGGDDVDVGDRGREVGVCGEVTGQEVCEGSTVGDFGEGLGGEGTASGEFGVISSCGSRHVVGGGRCGGLWSARRHGWVVLV